MNSRDTLNNEITLQTIALSLDNITKTLGNFATKKDLEKFSTKDDLENFATKDDLKSFATKSDLERFATKKDLEKFATKDDLESFATKDDLKSFATKDDLKSFATKKDLEKFATKDDLKSFATKSDLENSSKELDDLIGWLAATVKGELVRTEVRITDRIGILENKINELEQKVDRNHTYAVNQLDNILTHYARREEYNYYGERLKKLERKVFA